MACEDLPSRGFCPECAWTLRPLTELNWEGCCNVRSVQCSSECPQRVFRWQRRLGPRGEEPPPADELGQGGGRLCPKERKSVGTCGTRSAQQPGTWPSCLSASHDMFPVPPPPRGGRASVPVRAVLGRLFQQSSSDRRVPVWVKRLGERAAVWPFPELIRPRCFWSVAGSQGCRCDRPGPRHPGRRK